MSKRNDYSAFLSPIKDHSYIKTPYISPSRDYPYSIPADNIIQAFKDLQMQSKQLIIDIEESKNINNKYKYKLDECTNDRNDTSIDNMNNYNNDMNIYTTDILNIETKNQILLSKVTQLEQDNKAINDKITFNLLNLSQLETFILDYNIKIKERETHLAHEQRMYESNNTNTNVNNNSTSLDYSIANGNSSIKESIYIHKHQLQHIHNEIYTQKSIIIDRISEIKQKEILLKHLNALNTELLSTLTRQQLLSLDYQTRMTDLTINRFNFVPAKPSPRTKPYPTTSTATSKLHSKPALATTTSSSIVYSTSKPPVYSTTPTSATGTSRRKSTSYTVHRPDNTPAIHTSNNRVHNNNTNTYTSNTNTDTMYSSSQELCDRTELLTANQWAQYTSMRNKVNREKVKLATGSSDISTLQHHHIPTPLVSSQSKPVVYKSTRQKVSIEKYSDNTTSNITSNQTKKTRISKKKRSKSATFSSTTTPTITTTTRVPSSVFPSSTLPTNLTSNPTASVPASVTSTPYTAPSHLFTEMNSGSLLPRGGSTGQDRNGWPPATTDSSNDISNRVYNTDVYSDRNRRVSSDYSYTKLSDEQLKAYHNILSQPPLGQNYDPYRPVRLYDSDQGDRHNPPDSNTYTADDDSDDDSTGSNNDINERDVSIHIIYDPTISTPLYDIEEPAAVSVVPVSTVLTPVFLPTSVDPDPTKEFNLIAQQSMASPSNTSRHSSRGGGGGLSQTLPRSST